MARAAQRRQRRGGWSFHELARLRELYPRVAEERVARLLGRSLDSVRRRAKAMFRRPPRHGPWSAAEDDRLREAYGVLPLRAIALVVGRPAAAVRERARTLRASRRGEAWTDEELGRLKRLYGSRADDALEVCLSRARTEIAEAAAELCLAKDKGMRAVRALRPTMPRWSSTEVALLRELYPEHDNLEVARLLGRSVTSVANKASQLSLVKAPHVLGRLGRGNVARRRDRRPGGEPVETRDAPAAGGVARSADRSGP